MTTLTRSATSGIARPSLTRVDVQVGLLVATVAATTVAGLFVALLFPPAGEGGFFAYSTVARDSAFVWAFLTLAGVNLVVGVVSAVLATLVIVSGRGWGWATAGAAVAIAGAGFYAVGVGGWAMVYSFAADSGALDPATATRFIESVNANMLRVFGAPLGGALLILVGVVLIAVGLWRSGRIPKWLIVGTVVGQFLPFVLPPDGIVGVFVHMPQAITGILTGWYAWRLRPRTEAAS